MKTKLRLFTAGDVHQLEGGSKLTMHEGFLKTMAATFPGLYYCEQTKELYTEVEIGENGEIFITKDLAKILPSGLDVLVK